MTSSALPPPSWTVTTVLERSYAIARDNFAAFVTVALVLGAVSLVFDVLSLGLLAGVVHLLTTAAVSICLTWGTFRAIAGRRPEWEPMLRQAQGPLFGRLLLLGVVQYLVIGLSAILVIPPFFLLPLWAVTIPAMMVERLELGAAFQRSADLTRGRRLRILGVYVLFAVIFLIGGAVLAALLGSGAFGRLVIWIYAAVASIILHPLPAVFYVLLREEKEGVAATDIARAVE
jgi:hypothetical protein